MARGSNKENVSAANRKQKAPPKEKSAPKRAKWDSASDRILVDTLMDQRTAGNQTDNAQWKSDAWTAVAAALLGSEVKSGGCVKTASACTSRWSALKAKYQVVASIRKRGAMSGFGWDPISHCITASKEVWDAYIAKHPDHECWKTDSFPLYDEMASLVDGAVATGDSVFQPGLPSTTTLNQEDGSTPSSPPSPSSSGPSHSAARSPSPESQAEGADDTQGGDDDVQPLTISRKRTRAMSDSPSPAKRVCSDNPKRKVSAGHAMLAISGALDKVAMALAQPVGGPSDVERRTQATQIILGIDETQLSEFLKIKIIQLFRADIDYADQFLALSSKPDFAIQYILQELE